jgi:sterol desaturase/sphingolipid hydroxylase (fatty acid hydroxylase superfamily)
MLFSPLARCAYLYVMRTLARWTIFPAAVVAALGGALVALTHGVHGEVVVAVIFATTLPLVALLERIFPYRPVWNRSHGDLAADAAYLPITVSVNGVVDPAVRAGAAAAVGWLAPSVGAGLWPSGWPLLAQLGLACVVAELFDYLAHRMMHENAWLWRLHATHHSAPRLYWLNATRAHPGEMLFRGTVGVLPLALLGAGYEIFLLVAIVNVVVGFFQHANIDFALGPLSWIFSVGEMHRWHHSRERAEADSNYGNNFLFWDAVFGTRYRPQSGGAPERLGIAGLDAFPQGLAAQLLSPLRWATIERASH